LNVTGNVTTGGSALSLTLGGAALDVTTGSLNSGNGSTTIAASGEGMSVGGGTTGLAISEASLDKISAGSLTLQTTGNDIAIDTVTAHAGFNNLTLDSGADITIGTLAVGTAPGTLNLIAAGTITENAGGAITVATLTGNSGGTVKLAEGSNAIGDLGTFTVGGGDFNLNDGTTALSISGTVTVPGVLTLNAGSITEVTSGSLAVGKLTGTSAADVKLTNSNTVGDLGAFAVTAGDFILDNGTKALNIDGVVSVPGTLTLNAGNITELTGGTVTAGTLAGSSSGAVALNAGANDVTNLGGFTVASDFDLNNGANGLNVTGTVKVPGTLTLDAGSITETAGAVTAGTLTGGTTGAVALNGTANAIDNLGTFSATDFNLDDGATALNIKGAVSATGTLTLAAGSITEQSGGTVAAATLAGSTTGDTTLTQAGNAITEVGDFTTTTGNFSLSDGHELAVTGNVNSGGTIALTVPGTALAITGSLTSAGATTITAQAGTSLVIGADGAAPVGSLQISDASLAKVTAASLSLATTGAADDIFVDQVTAHPSLHDVTLNSGRDVAFDADGS